MLASIVIRTLNEARYLKKVFEALASQKQDNLKMEVVLVDSGSTDESVAIATANNAKIVNIKKEEFTFGRSLNFGCEAAQGEILVFISGHCVPTSSDWFENICAPIIEEKADYVYGRQQGGPTSKFSEEQLFKKYFPENVNLIPQDGFFCNNANSAISKKAWAKFKFDEELTGLEDMYLAKQLYEAGNKIAYVSTASVYHHHDESWGQVKRRYEREAIALRHIMPEVHVNLRDFCRYFISGVLFDVAAALQQQKLLSKFKEIIFFRFAQYWGSYVGNHETRELSRKQKEGYFYPKHIQERGLNGPVQVRSTATNESQ